jgi:hypothetical protein
LKFTILGPLKRIHNPREIILGKHGIYIKKGVSSGTMLPQVAIENDGLWKSFLAIHREIRPVLDGTDGKALNYTSMRDSFLKKTGIDYVPCYRNSYYSLLFISDKLWLYRLGIFSLNTHRKIWNTILATAFLFTALAGVVLALQINYKWDVPVIDLLLSWHVETGICLAVTGIFQFGWHLSYYRTLFKKSGNNKLKTEGNTRKNNSPSITVNLFVIGFTSTSIQLLLLREVLKISGGYQLISRLYLRSWLITSPAGAALAGKSKLNDIAKINLAFSLTPLLSLLFLFLLSGILLEPEKYLRFY